jgi:hypothetical protein
MKLSKQQVLKLIYEQQVWDSAAPDEVEPEEDVWGSGEALEQEIDYYEVEGLPPVESGIEIEEIVEKVKRKIRLRKIVEQVVAAEEVVEPEPAAKEVVDVAPPAEEERAGASASELRGWLSGKAAEVADLGISDPQIPALIAAMNDLIGQAQAGTLGAREDRVRANIAKA